MLITGIVLGVIVLFSLVAIGVFNNLVGLRNLVKEAWAQIDVQLKRRHDLIPNLVETVRGYAAHERGTLEAVTKARNIAQSAAKSNAPPEVRAAAESELSSALARLLVVAEAYPELKANTNFLALQEELTGTENKISFARQYYNDTVMNYNNTIQMFPSNIIAGMGGFKCEEFFKIDEADRAVPVVKF